MKILQIVGVLAVSALAVGCNQSSDTERASADTTGNVPRASRVDDTNTLTPTSRATNAPSRTYASDSTTDKAADNTARNVRDRSSDALTPGDQGTSDADREITRQVRRDITQNDQLSTVAKNVKIITVNGKVTLRGPVNNAQEQQIIESTAQKVNGVSGVDDQLEVKITHQ